MKIAILNTLYHPYKIGGAEVSVQLLAESLVDRGHSVSVITLHDATGSSLDHLNGVTLYRLPLRNVYWPFAGNPGRPMRLLWHLIDIYNPLARADVSRLLEQIQPDILHTNNLAGFSVAVWDAARTRGIPVIHTSRDYYLIHPNCMLYAANRNQDPNSLPCRLFSFIKKWRSQHISHYVGISNHVRALHKKQGYFRGIPAEVIYNPVTQPALSEHDAATGLVTLGYMGRIEPAKGIETALQVCQRLGPGYRLLVAGSGDASYMTKLQTTFADLNIDWLGHVSPERFFPAIDILLMPSQWAEPLGRVVLEANSHGVPVVGSRSGGIPEIISNGETGYACEATDINAFVAATEQLATQDRQRIRRHCLTWASQFTMGNIAAQYLRHFQNLTYKYPDKSAPATPPTI